MGALHQAGWMVRATDVPKCFFVLCPRCIVGVILEDNDLLTLRQLKRIGHDSRAVYEVISAWLRR